MMNTMIIDGVKAVITYDSEMDMFRGEFVGLNGGADFYADNIADLRKEGEISLRVFKEMCDEDGAPYFKDFSGKFNTRVPPALHADIVAAAQANGKSLNQWVADTLAEAIE